MSLLKLKNRKLDMMIVEALQKLDDLDPGTFEYTAMYDHVERLIRIQSLGKKKISPDTMAIVAGNLIGILIMVGYEHKHVITSKSLGFLLKPRID